MRAQREEAIRRQLNKQEEALRANPLGVEYNMDEVDASVLSVLAETYPWATPAVYEEVMQALERDYFLLQRVCLTKIEERGKEEDTPNECNVCGESETQNEDFLVLCDRCNMAVHQSCYGVAYIPEGNWLCRTCLLCPRGQPKCCLCLTPGGALKRTSAGNKWAHLLCALLTPGVTIGNTSLMEPIEVPPQGQHKVTTSTNATNANNANSPPLTRSNPPECSECSNPGGVLVKCSYRECPTVVHAGCAVRAANYYIDIKNALVYCRGHDPRRRADSFSVLLGPSDSNYPSPLPYTPRARPSIPFWEAPPRVAYALECIAPGALHWMMNRASAVTLSGQHPEEEALNRAPLADASSKASFIRSMTGVWAQRRQKREFSPGRKLRLDILSVREMRGWWGVSGAVSVSGNELAPGNGYSPLGVFQMAASAVAQARASVDKALKQAITKAATRRRKWYLLPQARDTHRATLLLDAVKREDSHGLFRDPVTDKVAPGYSTYVKRPISVSEIEQRVAQQGYCCLGAVLRDVRCMINNAYKYNGEESFVGREAARVEKEVYRKWRIREGDFIIARPGPRTPYCVLRVADSSRPCSICGSKYGSAPASTPPGCVSARRLTPRPTHAYSLPIPQVYALPKSLSQARALLWELNQGDPQRMSRADERAQDRALKRAYCRK